MACVDSRLSSFSLPLLSFFIMACGVVKLKLQDFIFNF